MRKYTIFFSIVIIMGITVFGYNSSIGMTSKKSVTKEEDKKSATLVDWIDFADMEKAQLKNPDKLIVLRVWASWCPRCAEMDLDVYTKADIADLIKKDFIPVFFDASDRGQAFEDLKQKYSVAGLPGTVFFDKDGNHIETIIGVAHPKEYKLKLIELVKIHLQPPAA